MVTIGNDYADDMLTTLHNLEKEDFVVIKWTISNNWSIENLNKLQLQLKLINKQVLNTKKRLLKEQQP